MDLNIVRLALPLAQNNLQAVTQLVSGRGGAFEDAVRLEACEVKDRSCVGCPLKDACPASVLIGRELSPDPDLVRWHQKPGLPFVFELTNEGEEFCLNITLLGPAIDHIVLILRSLNRILERKSDKRITVLDYQMRSFLLKQFENGGIDNIPVLSAAELLELNAASFCSIKKIDLELLSSLRLQRDGRQLKILDPVFFMRSVLRRVSSLFAYYGNDVDHERFRALSELAGEVTLVRGIRKDKPDISRARGISGRYELVGPFYELGPYLRLGELFHAGKGAAYGMGAFRSMPIS